MEPIDDAIVAPGTRLGEYEIVARIGEGGMGTVYSGVHPLIGKKVAIKVLKATRGSDAHDRFIQEARAVNQIGHPNIVDIFAFDRLPDGRPFLVMEYLQGETLKARLQRPPPLTYAEALRALIEVASALAAAHEAGIVHRDLKPDNIMLVETRNERAAKLLDFGVAKLIDPALRAKGTATGQTIGTPAFMSPEQCLGAPIDVRSDVYAFGVILFTMFTGRLPFEGDVDYLIFDGHVTKSPPRPSALAELPDGLEALILACLEKPPGARPANGRVLGAALESLRGGLSREQMSAHIPVPSAAVDRRATITLSGESEAPPLATGPTLARAPAPLAPLAPRRRLSARVVVPIALVAVAAAAVPLVRMRWKRAPAAVVVPVPAAPARSTPASGRLVVRTAARKAVWRIDDQPTGDGTGVLLLTGVTPGVHRLSIEAEGFQPRVETIEIVADVNTAMVWELAPTTTPPTPRRRSHERQAAKLAPTKPPPAPAAAPAPASASAPAPAPAAAANSDELPELERPF
jgi:serine/threonine-protein kinase